MKLFSDFIANYQGGKLDEILGSKIAEVVAAVENMRKKGSIALSLDIKPAEAGTMSVTASYAAKPPVNSSLTGTMFVGKNNELLACHPDQRTLELIAPAPVQEKLVKAI